MVGFTASPAASPPSPPATAPTAAPTTAPIGPPTAPPIAAPAAPTPAAPVPTPTGCAPGVLVIGSRFASCSTVFVLRGMARLRVQTFGFAALPKSYGQAGQGLPGGRLVQTVERHALRPGPRRPARGLQEDPCARCAARRGG